MKAVVRIGEERDLPAVEALWEKLDAFHHELGLAFPEVEYAGNKWAESFKRTLGRFSFLWVAEVDGKAKGFLLGRIKQSPAFLGAVQVGEISDLYVSEVLRGAGVASQLVEMAMKKFGELHVHSVEVQILADNEGGMDFWTKQGFKTDLTLVRKVL